MRERVIRDEIHKDILVPPNHALIIDTKEFQRLRSIQQLSTCEYVFPAANHNRFSHSLGAYFLATKMTALRQLELFQQKMSQFNLLLYYMTSATGLPHLLETPEVLPHFTHMSIGADFAEIKILNWQQ